jgi:hypothetical protein
MMPNYILGLLSIEEETQSLGSYHRSWVVHNFTGSRSSLTNLLESSNAILGVKVEKNNRGRLDGHDEKKKQETTLFLLNKETTLFLLNKTITKGLFKCFHGRRSQVQKSKVNVAFSIFFQKIR